MTGPVIEGCTAVSYSQSVVVVNSLGGQHLRGVKQVNKKERPRRVSLRNIHPLSSEAYQKHQNTNLLYGTVFDLSNTGGGSKM